MTTESNKIKPTDDGLCLPPIGRWGGEKYKLFQIYTNLFTKTMQSKWDSIIYIDLFAGAGFARIKDTDKIVSASPLIALDLENKFNKYIFCEQDKDKITALQERATKFYPELEVNCIQGDANEKVEDILDQIPQHKKDFKVLCFCFVDPFKVDNLKFETIKRLSDKFVDFLVLIPAFMDAHRNVQVYLEPSNYKADNFLGTTEWRGEWEQVERGGIKFGNFFTDYFAKSMEKLGYIYSGLEKTVLIRSDDNNLPLYRLALFSRSKLGKKFWDVAKKYSTPQLTLL